MKPFWNNYVAGEPEERRLATTNDKNNLSQVMVITICDTLLLLI
jgi:hypothetical protein